MGFRRRPPKPPRLWVSLGGSDSLIVLLGDRFSASQMRERLIALIEIGAAETEMITCRSQWQSGPDLIDVRLNAIKAMWIE